MGGGKPAGPAKPDPHRRRLARRGAGDEREPCASRSERFPSPRGDFAEPSKSAARPASLSSSQPSSSAGHGSLAGLQAGEGAPRDAASTIHGFVPRIILPARHWPARAGITWAGGRAFGRGLGREGIRGAQTVDHGPTSGPSGHSSGRGMHDCPPSRAGSTSRGGAAPSTPSDGTGSTPCAPDASAARGVRVGRLHRDLREARGHTAGPRLAASRRSRPRLDDRGLHGRPGLLPGPGRRHPPS